MREETGVSNRVVVVGIITSLAERRVEERCEDGSPPVGTIAVGGGGDDVLPVG